MWNVDASQSVGSSSDKVKILALLLMWGEYGRGDVSKQANLLSYFHDFFKKSFDSYTLLT